MRTRPSESTCACLLVTPVVRLAMSGFSYQGRTSHCAVQARAAGASNSSTKAASAGSWKVPSPYQMLRFDPLPLRRVGVETVLGSVGNERSTKSLWNSM